MSATVISPEPPAVDPFLRQFRSACLERAGIDVRFMSGMPAMRRKLSELDGMRASERLSIITRFGPRPQGPSARARATRVLVPPEIATGPTLDHLVALSEEGVDVRLSERATKRLTIVNRKIALVELTGVLGRGEPESVRINNPALIRMAASRFEQIWATAAPLTDTAAITINRFTDRQRRVLEMLADGLTDEQVSRELGLSARSIRSEMACVRQVLGARSRFEAGMKYAELIRA
ncbi:LuxR C-terminal-related transcriptional regulator [Ammonicoccus fulvus]|uniref:LuxR C-terminal-related transcriptional regulator n=1 Tax=Ammonicoccus fulvus TaxID=3138240 RepID=A0ABZ3FK08_9ACTN